MSKSDMRATPSGLAARNRFALRLVTELMAIPGRSGQERAVAEFITAALLEAGLSSRALTTDTAHRKSEIGGECGNLIAKLPGTIRGPRRLLMAHMDTVPLCVGARPIRQGAEIVPRDATTGLGADNRAGVATVLTAALTCLKDNLPHPPLTLFFPVQEEIGLVGSRHVDPKKLGNPALCFNWDGGDPARLVVGATGATAMDITIGGVASHAGVHPEDGVSAAAIAAYAIADLDRKGWHGLVRKRRETGTSNVGVLSGGEATNVVMPELRIRAEARSHSPAFREQIVNEYRSAFEHAAKSVRNARGDTGRVDFQAELKYEAFRLRDDSPVLSSASRALANQGLEPQQVIGNGGLDANWMTAHGLPTVTLGCGQHNIHTVNERLDVEEFLLACRIAVDLATARF